MRHSTTIRVRLQALQTRGQRLELVLRTAIAPPVWHGGGGAGAGRSKQSQSRVGSRFGRADDAGAYAARGPRGGGTVEKLA